MRLVIIPSELKKGINLPSTSNIHKPHGNSYTWKHQQGCNTTDKQWCRRWTDAHVRKKNSNSRLLKNLGSVVQNAIYTRELHFKRRILNKQVMQRRKIILLYPTGISASAPLKGKKRWQVFCWKNLVYKVKQDCAIQKKWLFVAAIFKDCAMCSIPGMLFLKV